MFVLNSGKIRKFKSILGFLIYFAVTTAFSWISTLLYIVPLQIIYEDGKYQFFISAHPILDIFKRIQDYKIKNVVLDFNNVFWSIAFIVVLYFVSRHLIKNKIELE